MVPRALKAADELSKEGIEVEVIDPRTLSPLDSAPIEASVKKTGHILVVHEAVKSGGIGAEIAARIAEGPAFDYLDAQIGRLGGAFTPIPYGEGLERCAIPQEADIVAAVKGLLARRS
jgi:pyruvate dehydrogenase E1 component beta subunit